MTERTYNRDRLLVVRARAEVCAVRVIKHERAVVRVRLLRPHERALEWRDACARGHLVGVERGQVRGAHERADLGLERRRGERGARGERRRRARAGDPRGRVLRIRAARLPRELADACRTIGRDAP
jgi:hypothetical protein